MPKTDENSRADAHSLRETQTEIEQLKTALRDLYVALLPLQPLPPVLQGGGPPPTPPV